MTRNDPIGVFDSGVGGISVLHELRRQLPAEDFLYVADSGYCPYGPRGETFIQARSRQIVDFLVSQGAKAIVIACNTATAAAATMLRQSYILPIVGMEPAIKPAVAATRAGVIGVLATVGTVRSERLVSLIERFGRDVEVLTQPCPGLAEQVEAGDLTGPLTRDLLHRYTTPLLERGADVLVLGCTHYPFLRDTLTALIGPEVTLIDTNAAVARQTMRVLSERDLLRQNEVGDAQFWTSSAPDTSASVISTLYGSVVSVTALLTTVE